MRRFRIEFDSEWKFEWHQYYKCLNIFQIYFFNDGEAKGIEFHLFNFWMRLKVLHKVEHYCQRQIEGKIGCSTQCDHCKIYYKPLEDEAIR